MAQLFSPESVKPAPGPQDGLPRFSLIVSPEQSNGWHAAFLLREATSPAFFLRSITVPRPFLLARPARSIRQPEFVFRPDELSPARTSPSRRLVVNWDWEHRDETTDQLRFYVKCRRPVLLWRKCGLAVRLRLKEMARPHRRLLLRIRSATIDWRGSPQQLTVPDNASSPAAF